MTNIGLQLTPKQQIKMIITPEFRQSIHLLQLSAQELTHHIEKQIAENPLLELDESLSSDQLTTHRTTISKEIPWENITKKQVSLTEHLEEQLRFLSLTPTEQKLCRYLIGNLNEHGYLKLALYEVCQSLQVKESQVESAIATIQSLDPIGVGARSLSECIKLQLQNQDQPHRLAIEIAHKYLPEVAEGKWEKVAKELSVTIEAVQQAVAVIKQCNPYPCANFSTHPPQYIYPDVTVKRSNQTFQISIHRGGISSLQITPDYHTFLQHAEQQPAFADQLKTWYQSAQWLIKGISQRQNTLHRVTKAIIAKQQDFFIKETSLKPLTRQQIANELNLHESTISRATKNKYMQTPFGVFPFSHFFPTGLSHGITSSSVKQKIQALIKQESRQMPFSDQKLADHLNMEGIRISRRTVAKYRKELGIASSSTRKRFI